MLQKLKELYETYITHVTAQWQEKSFGDVVTGMFSGQGRFGRDVWIAPFLRALEELTAECAARPVSDTLAAEMVEYMLFEAHGSPPAPAADGLDAADGKALCLVKLLSDETRARIYNMYREKLRRRPGLPGQKALLKALKPK